MGWYVWCGIFYMWRPHGNRVLETRFIRVVFNEIKHQQFKPPENTNTSKLLRILWSTREPITRSSQTTPLSDHRTTARDPGRKATQVRARPRFTCDPGRNRAWAAAWPTLIWSQPTQPWSHADTSKPPITVLIFSFFLFLIFFLFCFFFFFVFFFSGFFPFSDVKGLFFDLVCFFFFFFWVLPFLWCKGPLLWYGLFVCFLFFLIN